MPYLMGIDIGSTSLKAVIYNTEGNIVASGSYPNGVSYMDPEHPNWAFRDPQKIWNGIVSAIRQAIVKIPDPGSIKGVAVTGTGADGLPVGKKGKWLYPFISWHCSRTEPVCQMWRGKADPERVFSITGRQMAAYDTIHRLIWMNDNHPEIMRQTDKWLLIEDYINFMLCGKKATDYSMASSTSVFNPADHTWSGELIKLSGVRKELFPEVLPSGTYLGEVTLQAAILTGLAEGTPVVIGGHDYHCAALASGAFKPGVVMDITGTFEMVLAALDKANMDLNIYKAGLTVESHVVKNTYSITGFNVPADMLEWFRKQYGYEEKAMASPCGSKGVFFLPHFSGSYCPVIDRSSQGAFVGLVDTVEKGDMLRSIIEGLNYQFREMVEAIERPMGFKSGRIIAVGGAARNKFRMQNKADVTGKVIEVPDIEEAAALGAAILAGIGVGIYSDESEALDRTFKRGKMYYPEEAQNKSYNKYFEIYKQLYPALKNINNDIFQTFRL